MTNTSVRIQYTRLAKRLFAAAWIVFAASVGVVAALTALPRPPGPLGATRPWGTAFEVAVLWLPLAALLLALFGLVMWIWRRKRTGLVEVRPGRLTVPAASGHEVIGSKDSAAGLAVPRPVGAEAWVETKDGRKITIAVADLSTADSLIEALALDAAHRRYEMRWNRKGNQIAVGFVAYTVFGLALGVPLWLRMDTQRTEGEVSEWVSRLGLFLILGQFSLLPLAIAWAIRRFAGYRVTVGTDGVAIYRGRTARFVPFSEVTEVRDSSAAPLGHNLVLELSGGREERIWANPDDALLRAALLRRLETALDAATRRAAEAEGRGRGIDLPGRDGRSIAEWKAALQRQVDQGMGYRNASLPLDSCRHVLEDPQAPPEQRLAAALALAGSEETRGHLDEVAEASADPVLRARLECITRKRLTGRVWRGV